MPKNEARGFCFDAGDGVREAFFAIAIGAGVGAFVAVAVVVFFFDVIVPVVAGFVFADEGVVGVGVDAGGAVTG